MQCKIFVLSKIYIQCITCNPTCLSLILFIECTHVNNGGKIQTGACSGDDSACWNPGQVQERALV